MAPIGYNRLLLCAPIDSSSGVSVPCEPPVPADFNPTGATTNLWSRYGTGEDLGAVSADRWYAEDLAQYETDKASHLST